MPSSAPETAPSGGGSDVAGGQGSEASPASDKRTEGAPSTSAASEALTATVAAPASAETVAPVAASQVSGLPNEPLASDSVLGPVAAEPALVQAQRRAARAALLLDAFPVPLQPADAAAAAEGTFAVATAATKLAGEDAANATRAVRGRQDAGPPSVEHELLPPPPPGGGGGSGGNAAAASGGGGGSSAAAASALVAPLTQKAPAAVRLLAFQQPSWRTSFFVLIPERPD